MSASREVTVKYQRINTATRAASKDDTTREGIEDVRKLTILVNTASQDSLNNWDGVNN